MTRRILLLSAASLLVAASAFPRAQSYGGLEGVVRDAQGFVLPGVTVTLASDAIVGVRVATTDVDGSYRFPALAAGTYTLSFELLGFQTAHREGVVAVARTSRIDPTLDIAGIAETVPVGDDSPIVDVKATGASATFEKVAIEDVPSATDLWAVLQQSPGIRMRGLDVGGSHKSQQSDYESFGVRSQARVVIEGVNSTEGTGGTGGYYDYYSIEEFQVSGAGAGIEMSTPGAQIVATVKKGGNAPSALAHFDFEPPDDLKSPFVTDNIDDEIRERGGTSAPVREFREFHVDVGGPVVRDEFWFYGAFNNFKIDKVVSGQDPASAIDSDPANGDSDQDPAGGDSGPDPATDIGLFDTVSAKINYQFTERDQLVGYSQWSRKQKPFRGLSSTVPAESTRAQDSWTWLHKAEWQRAWNDRLLSTIVAAHFGFGWPMVPDLNPGTPTSPDRPARVDTATGHQRGAGWQPFTFFRYKPQVTGQLSYHLPTDDAGSHDIKLGWDFQIDSRQFGWDTSSGAIRYRDNSALGPPSPDSQDPGMLGAADEIDFFNVPTLNDDRNRHTELYAQDTWTLNDRVTLTLGARFGRQDLYYLAAADNTPLLGDAGFGVSFDPVDSASGEVEVWTNVAPRIGATFDLTGEGRTVLKGFYGRYYGNAGTGLPAANPAGQRQLRYKWTDVNENGFYDGEQELGDFLECFGSCGGGAPVAPETELMFTDELSVSIEHELAADASARFSYVRKQMRNRWAGSDGLTTLNIARATDNLTQPFVTTCGDCPEGFDGSILNLRTLADGAPASEPVYANAPGDANGDYDTFQFAFVHRFRGRVFFNASFDYQARREPRSASGESLSPLTLDPIAAAWFPAYNAELGQSFDSTNWNFRASARYVAPHEVGLALSYRHQSGWPWAPIHRVDLPNVGTQPFFIEPIENNRSDNLDIVDVRIDKSWVTNGKYRTTIMADVYNVTNTNAETNFNLRTGSSFDEIIEWVGGRTLKIGFRFQF